MAQLSNLLSPSTNSQVGLILTERLINMPSEIVPPMYTMLLEEIGWALEEKEPYTFSHYLILSKTYKEVDSKLDQEESRPTKKKKKGDCGSRKHLLLSPPRTRYCTGMPWRIAISTTRFKAMKERPTQSGHSTNWVSYLKGI